MTLLKRLRERRESNRDVSLLWGHLHDLTDQLTDARRERDIWQDEAILAQLEAEQLKSIVKDLKS